MDQNLIAGIGNIYADEILWEAKVHPLLQTGRLNNQQLRAIYKAIRKVLQKAIKKELFFKKKKIDDFREKGNH